MPPNDTFSQFSLSIFALNGLLTSLGETVTRPLGQSSARWQILGRAGYQPYTVSQMARDMGSSRQSVQYTADALERDGLISYEDNPADRRAQLIRLTTYGAEILAAIYAKNAEWSQHIMADLNPTQLAEVTQALESIAHVFETHLDQVTIKEK